MAISTLHVIVEIKQCTDTSVRYRTDTPFDLSVCMCQHHNTEYCCICKWHLNYIYVYTAVNLLTFTQI